MSIYNLLSSRKDRINDDLKIGVLIFGISSFVYIIIAGAIANILEIIILTFFIITLFNYSNNQPKDSFLYINGRFSALFYFIYWIISFFYIYLFLNIKNLPDDPTKSELVDYANYFILIVVILVFSSFFFLLGSLKFTKCFNIISNENGTKLIKITAITKMIYSVLFLISSFQLLNAANLYDTSSYDVAFQSAGGFLGLGLLFKIVSDISQFATGVVLYSRLDYHNK